MIGGSPTVRPVDGPGWYECVDGSVVEVKYLEGKGTLHSVTDRVASWADVPKKSPVGLFGRPLSINERGEYV